jgi:predicted dehydrogenase
MKTVCIIGYGYWGAILSQQFIQNPHFIVKYICDRNAEKLALAKSVTPTDCILISDPKKALEDPSVDLVVIATQAAHHFDLCISALNHHKNIFVEKPFTLNSHDAKIIFDIAKKHHKKIWIDHTFLFNPAYQQLKHCVAQGMIGNPMRYHATRTAFGLFQQDANIIWHLMIHDIYILLDLFNAPDTINSVTSSASIIPGITDSVIASFTFQNQLHATVHCDMLFAEKRREIVITGDKGILVWDETRQHKLQFYPYSASFNAKTRKVSYQLDDVKIIKVDISDALVNEVNALYEFLLENSYLSFPDKNTTLKIIGLLESVDAMDRQSCPNLI